MTSSPQRVLLIFLDGVGIGPDDPDRNPFLRARLPTLRGLLDGAVPTLANPRVAGRWAEAFPLDATLGVDGTPQSGTGQASLLTGRNGPEVFGRHFGPWTPVRLRSLVEHESVLRRARESGLTVAFANTYPRGWPGPRGGRRIAGPPLAARGAGVLDRHEEALGAGRAVSSEIVNRAWRDRLGHTWLPDVSEEDAGRNLAAVAAEAHLTLFAHYATDHAGHEGEMGAAVRALERVDRFLSGVVAALAPGTTLVLVSDHGNIEDVREGHTRNPVLAVAAGPASGALRRGISDLTDVTPAVLSVLEGPEDSTPGG